MPHGAFITSNHFQQMGANCVETMIFGKPVVAIKRLEQFKTVPILKQGQFGCCGPQFQMPI